MLFAILVICFSMSSFSLLFFISRLFPVWCRVLFFTYRLIVFFFNKYICFPFICDSCFANWLFAYYSQKGSFHSKSVVVTTFILLIITLTISFGFSLFISNLCLFSPLILVSNLLCMWKVYNICMHVEDTYILA